MGLLPLRLRLHTMALTSDKKLFQAVRENDLTQVVHLFFSDTYDIKIDYQKALKYALDNKNTHPEMSILLEKQPKKGAPSSSEKKYDHKSLSFRPPNCNFKLPTCERYTQ